MIKRKREDQLYMDIAYRIAQMSYGRRLKVGTVIVQHGNIISMGWNGTPAGEDNNCEDELPDGTLRTKACVIHSEDNAMRKLAHQPGAAHGATAYVTHAPCEPCAKKLIRGGITRVVVGEEYRDRLGVERLLDMDVEYELFDPVIKLTTVEEVVAMYGTPPDPLTFRHPPVDVLEYPYPNLSLG